MELREVLQPRVPGQELSEKTDMERQQGAGVVSGFSDLGEVTVVYNKE